MNNLLKSYSLHIIKKELLLLNLVERILRDLLKT